MQDLLIESRQALLRLRREWGFSLSSILTLALGIGVILASSWIFYAALLGPLPYPHGSRLVSVSLTMPGNPGLSRPMSPVAYAHFRTGARALADAAFYRSRGENLDVHGRVTRITAVETTGSLFPTLGVKPLLGRVFADRASEPGAPPVVVLSDRFWQREFDGRADALGATLDLNGHAYTVIGIMPPGFHFPDRGVALWLPYPFTPYDFRYFQLTEFRGHLIGRLAPGRSIAALDTQVRTLTAALLRRFPPAARKDFFAHFSARAESWREATSGGVRSLLTLIEMASVLLLILVWFNLANLFLARGLVKRGEINLREVLGAQPGSFLVRFALETFWITLPGLLLGLLIGAGLTDFMVDARILPGTVPIAQGKPLFMTVLTFAVAGSSILVMTLVSYLSTRRMDLGGALREAGQRSGTSRGAARLRRILVGGQTALATAMIGITLLLAHTMLDLASVHPGFRTAHTLAFDVDLPSSQITPQKLWPTLDHLQSMTGAIPGVRATGITSGLPFAKTNSFTEAIFPVPWSPRDPMVTAYLRAVDSGYLKTLGLVPLRGRLFTPEDAGSTAGVAVIDRLAAHQLFGHDNPVGRIFTLNTPNNTRPGLRYRVIGLVRTVRNRHLGRSPTTGTVYLDAPQAGALAPAWFSLRTWAFVIRSPLRTATLKTALRRTVRKSFPWLPIYHLRTLEARLHQRLRNRDALLGLIGLFALGALLLAAIGLYGVESYLVNRRTREFGIRTALGADPPALLRHVLGEAARLFGTGLLVGLAGMIVLGHLFSTLLYGIAPDDPFSISSSIALLALVFLLATWIPAARASRIPPAVALHRE